MYDLFAKHGIIVEYRRDGTGKHHHRKYHHKIEGKQHRHNDSERLFYAIIAPVTVVIAHDRDDPLPESRHRDAHELYRALQHRKSADVYVAVILQTAVQNEADKALRACHDEWCGAKSKYRPDNASVKAQISFFEPERRFGRGEESNHPRRAERLRNDGCKRRTSDTHSRGIYEQRVKHDVQKRADYDRQHTYPGSALSIYKRVQPRRKHHKQRARHINRKVVHRIADRRLGSAREQQ